MRSASALLKVSIFGFAFGMGSTVPVAAQSVYSGEHPHLVTPEQLTWNDAPAVAPGAKIAVIEGPINKAVPFTFRLMIPANSKIAPHTHPTFERVTVLSGTFHFAHGTTYDPAQTTALHPGGVAVMPPNTPMFGYTKEDTVIQLHGIGPWGLSYLNPADDPRKK